MRVPLLAPTPEILRVLEAIPGGDIARIRAEITVDETQAAKPATSGA
ncbi:MAG: hypothetical protein WC655_29050 [Candidatus Hydrogenedentales bacterium]